MNIGQLYEKIIEGYKLNWLKKLHVAAGVPYGRVTIEVFDKFDATLRPMCRLVVLRKMVGAPVLWKSDNEEGTPLFVLLRNGHCDCVSSPGGMLEVSNFCSICFKTKQDFHHRCSYRCSQCKYPHGEKCVSGLKVSCVICARDFESLHCYKRHLEVPRDKTKSTCQFYHRCKECHMTWRTTSGAHKCGESWCSACRESKAIGHLCYMDTVDEKWEREERKRNRAKKRDLVERENVVTKKK